MTTRSLMGAMLLTVALVGCSGGDDIADPTTTSVSTQASVAPSSTLEATAGPPNTTAVITVPVTTVVETVAPTAPPVTLDADVALAEAVARDWKESIRLLNEALMDPNDPERTAAALAYTAEPFRTATEQFIADFRTAGQRILPDPPVEPTLTVESGPEPVIDTADEVDITVCEVNPWVLVETVGGADKVIDDDIVTNRYDVRLRLVDGIWKTIRNSVPVEVEGAEGCDA